MTYRINSLSVLCSMLTAYETPQFLYNLFYSFWSAFPVSPLRNQTRARINSALGYLSLVVIAVLNASRFDRMKDLVIVLPSEAGHLETCIYSQFTLLSFSIFQAV